MKDKVLLTVFFIIFLLFIPMVSCKANSINSIDMDINIDKSGNAHVIEIWDTTLNQGTEGYRTFKNSPYSNFFISDFSVTMVTNINENGNTTSDISNENLDFSYLNKWDTSASFSDKKHKCGIHKIPNGEELCWGISKYGKNQYILKYTINNFVSNYTDTQGIYFNLLNLDQAVGNAKIVIHSDIMPFSLENARIWGFGYNGSINFLNGTIAMDSQGPLDYLEYMVILVRFQKNIFNTTNKSKYSFDKIYESAMEGNIEEKQEEKKEIINAWLVTILIISPFILIAIYSEIKYKQEDKIIEEFENGKKIKKQEVQLWREIPCENNLDFAYWVSYTYANFNESLETLKKGLIGAILLKWIYEGKVTVTKSKEGLFNISKNKYAINISNIGELRNDTEDALYRLLKRAAGSNKILEPNELKKWCRKNYTSFGYFFDDVLRRGKDYINTHGYILTKIEEVPHRKRTQKITHIIYSDKLRQEAIKIRGLKKFLLDYSLIHEKEVIDVHLWNKYLIFANLLGIADKVEKQFKTLYPDFNYAPDMNVEITNIIIHTMVREVFKGTLEGQSASYSGSSSYSGGGGSSFSSGGHSSGGSSGGGFR